MGTQEHKIKHEYAPGETIFREGEPGECAYIIDTGMVEVSALRGSDEVKLATLKEGEIFGEMALLDKTVRTASVTSLTHTRLISINRDLFNNRIDSTDPVIKLCIKMLSARLRRSINEMMTGRQNKGRTTAYRADDEDHRPAIEILKLEEELVEALEHWQFEIHYQPLFELNSGGLQGFEALLRWQHPSRGLLEAKAFINIAEKVGLIVEIGRRIIQQACHDLAQLGAEFNRSFIMNINLAGRQLDLELPKIIHKSLLKERIHPGQLRLEVTERVLICDPDTARNVLSELRSLGVKIALDDFGTGYSSLNYLSRFKVDTIKIDDTFVRTMRSNRASLEIVRAVTALARALNLELIAEGIEDEIDAKLLKQLGCELGQGFLYCRPYPLHQLMDYVQEHISQRQV